jgi:hypothetical protein
VQRSGFNGKLSFPLSLFPLPLPLHLTFSVPCVALCSQLKDVERQRCAHVQHMGNTHSAHLSKWGSYIQRAAHCNERILQFFKVSSAYSLRRCSIGVWCDVSVRVVARKR